VLPGKLYSSLFPVSEARAVIQITLLCEMENCTHCLGGIGLCHKRVRIIPGDWGKKSDQSNKPSDGGLTLGKAGFYEPSSFPNSHTPADHVLGFNGYAGCTGK